MKDTEAWAVVAGDTPWFGLITLTERTAQHLADTEFGRDEVYTVQPVVIVSAERYRRLVALEASIKRWVTEEQEKEAEHV
jgi:hypothetical protein